MKQRSLLFALAGLLSLSLVVLWCNVGRDDLSLPGDDQAPRYGPSLNTDTTPDKKKQHHATPAPMMAGGSRPRTHVVAPTLSPSLDGDSTPQQELSPEFRFCRQAHLADSKANLPDHEIDIWYQCTGKDYNKFGPELALLVQEQIASGQRPPTWGHRPTALPAKTTLLLWGNSHLRQVAHAWACQYADQVLDLQHWGDEMDPNMVFRVTFQNQATLYTVVNSYVAYTNPWKQNLEQQLQLKEPLELTVNAVVSGMFNYCAGGNSNMVDHMAAVAANRTDMECTSTNLGPSMTSLTQVFTRQPILYIPMFSLSRSRQINNTRKEMKSLDRTTALNPRTYIDAMQNECGSNNRLERTKCRNDGRAKENMHRCMGPLGGHPDLVAWDAMEWAFEALSTTPPS